MIVGGYDLHLYCRNDARHLEERRATGRHTGFAQFSGYNRQDAYRQARAAKWKFTGKDVLCPECVKCGNVSRLTASE